MATKPVSKRESGPLPQFEKIRVADSLTQPNGEVEVAPGVGRIAFQNEDNKEYRIRFWSKDGGEKTAIDIVLRALETITVAIKQDDEFFYYVVEEDGHKRMEAPGGPIRN
jgi:hypothetical protein